MLTLARNWWAVVLRGALAILLGILVIAWPGSALVVAVALFGAFVLVDGVFAVVGAYRAIERKRVWWPLALEGLSGIAVGIITFVWPQVTAVVLVILIAAWAFVTGVLEIAAAVRLRKEIRGEWLLALAGVLSVGFAVLIVFFPGLGALAIIWAIGAYAVFFGVVLLALGLRLRGVHRATAGLESLG